MAESIHASRIVRSPYFIISITVLLICLILSPYATNGFWGDDALNSQIRFAMERLQVSVWDFSFKVFQRWLTVEGRIMSGYLHGYSLFYLFSDLQSLRLAQCATVLLNIGLFAYILYYLGLKRNAILLWAILFVGLFQISDALDPTAAYAFHFQFVAIQLFIPVIFLLKWSRHRKSKHLVYAMIFWFWSMMYYEINVIFLAMAVVFILKKSQGRRATFQNLVIVAVPMLIYGLLNYYFRSHASNPSYQGSSLGQASLFFPAYVRQLSASLPLSYFMALNNKVSLFLDLLTIMLHSKLAWAIFTFAAIIFYNISPPVIKTEFVTLDTKFEIIVISLSMIFLPPILPAISARYQVAVDWGRGTLPVYYQYFGAAFLILWMLSRINLHSQIGKVAFALAIGFYLSFSTMINTQTVTHLDDYYRGPRELFISQARNGLFAMVVDGDIVELSNTPHYVNGNLIFEGCGKRVFVIGDDHSWYPEAPSLYPQRFILSRDQSNGAYGLTKYPATQENVPK